MIKIHFKENSVVLKIMVGVNLYEVAFETSEDMSLEMFEMLLKHAKKTIEKKWLNLLTPNQ